MKVEVARTDITIKSEDGSFDWMEAAVVTTHNNGRYTVKSDNIPEDFIPPTHHFKDERAAFAEHFWQVMCVREMVEDCAEQEAVVTSYFRPKMQAVA